MSLDVPRMNRVANWLRDLPPPVYPPGSSTPRSSEGDKYYRQQRCFDCHGLKEEQFKNHQAAGCAHQVDQDRQLRGSTRTRSTWPTTSTLSVPDETGSFTISARPGYANQPLDGLWARGPISITARCQPCATCSTRLAPRRTWNSLAIPFGLRSGRAGPWPRRTNGPRETRPPDSR